MGNTIVQLRGPYCCGRINAISERRDDENDELSSGHSAAIAERDIRGMSKAFNVGSYDDVESAVLSCRPRQQKEKVPGTYLALNYLPSGWQTGSHLGWPEPQGCF